MQRNAFIERFPFFYGWVIVGVSLIVMLVAYGVWWSFPVFYVAILEAFNWTRAETATIFTVGSVVYGLSSVVAGLLIDRFGPRKVLPVASLILAAGCVISAYSHQIWQFFVAYSVFMGFGTVTVGFIPNAAILANWFVSRRGTAMGIASVGEGVAPLLAVITQRLISSIGWSNSYLVLAALVVVILVPLTAVFMRWKPENVGLVPDGKPMISQSPVKRSGADYRLEIVDRKWVENNWTLAKGIKTYRFWTLLGIMFTLGLTMGILLTHQVVLTRDIGYTEATAAFIYALTGVIVAISRFGGILADRLGREFTGTLAVLVGAAGIVALLFVNNTSQLWLLYLYALAFGFGLGLFSPVYSCTAADLFGGKGFGAILGLANIGWGLGSGIGAWTGGFLFDRNGNYDLALIVGMISLLIMGLFTWIASPRKIRRVVKVTVI